MANKVASYPYERRGVEVVCGKDKKPQSDEKKILHWENLNDKALSLIGLGLGDEVIYHLDFDSTAQELWEKFEGLFDNKVIISPPRILQTPDEA